MKQFTCHWLSSLFCMLVVVSGCQRPDFAEVVHGVVTLDGKPLGDAFVEFIPDDGRRKSVARTKSDGSYRLIYSHQRRGAWIGDHQVTVSTLSLHQQGESGPIVAEAEEIIPKQYNTESTLFAEVKPGENIFNWDLSSVGEIKTPFPLGEVVGQPFDPSYDETMYGADAESETRDDTDTSFDDEISSSTEPESHGANEHSPDSPNPVADNVD